MQKINDNDISNVRGMSEEELNDKLRQLVSNISDPKARQTIQNMDASKIKAVLGSLNSNMLNTFASKMDSGVMESILNLVRKDKS